MIAAPSTAALSETSGTPRGVPPTDETEHWKAGRPNTEETPPPPAAGWPSSAVSFQTLSGAVRCPAWLRCSCVPPTPVTRGSEAGQLTTRLVKNVVPAAFEALLTP